MADHQQGKTVKEADEEICFGAIFGCYAWPSENNLLSKEVLDLPLLGEGFIAFQIQPADYPKVLRIPGKTRDHPHFAMLDRLSLVLLGAIEKLRRIRFESIVELEQLKMREETFRATPLAKVLEITINVYGPRSIAKDVRDKLDEVDGYLKHPKALAGGMPYTNPCWFYDDGLDIAWLVGCDNEHSSWRAKEIDLIKAMFGYPGHRALADTGENAFAAVEAEPDPLEQPSLRSSLHPEAEDEYMYLPFSSASCPDRLDVLEMGIGQLRSGVPSQEDLESFYGNDAFHDQYYLPYRE